MKKPRAAPKPQGAPLQVFVRMYRALEETDWESRQYKGLLGDCFLVRVVEDGRTMASILIDCGILMGSPDAPGRMQRIVQDIRAVSGGRLDLLVVTHEHWDHISGFSQAGDLFFGTDPLKVDRLWFAWTENEEDASTRALKSKLGRKAQAFAALADRMQAANRSGVLGADRAYALNGLEAFLGPLDNAAAAATPEGLGAAAQARLKGAEIMSALKRKVEAEGEVEYLSPGEVRAAPGSLRAFVLGPPRDFKRLFKDAPSAGDKQETYLTGPSFETLMFEVAAGGSPEPSRDSPFGPRHQRLRTDRVENAATDAGSPPPKSCESGEAIIAWIQRRYFDPIDQRKADQERRRIDADWLGAAGPLAMKLDSDTNNTSLVLAFELPDGTFMLFPGDAQVGNWLSWHDQDYDAGGTQLKAADLLKRVRFYKVGHHGSHNATLDELGLGLMTHPELVAAIPTDEELGKRQGSKGWEMPNPRVKGALLKRTRGRIIRNDRRHDQADWASDPDTKDHPPSPDFFDRLDPQNLYIEYRVFGPK